MNYEVIRPSAPKKEDLKIIYDLLNNICNNPNLFYTKDDVKKLKKDKDNKWL